MKRLPASLKDLESQIVEIIHHEGTPSEHRTRVEANIDAYRGIFPVGGPVQRGDVIEYTDGAGDRTRLLAAEVKVYALASPSHTEVFWEGALHRTGGGPGLILQDLHHEVVIAAGRHYSDGSYAEAVVEALLTLEYRVRRQSGIDRWGAELMAEALTGDPPPIRVAALDGLDGRSEQEGLRWLFMGAIQGIETPMSHEALHRDSPERALEQLAIASALFHRLDHAYRTQDDQQGGR